MRYIIVLFISVLLTSCSLFTTQDTTTNVARVNTHYLTEAALNDALVDNAVIDSAAFIQNYINNWATDQLLLDGALRNVPAEEQERFESLVAKYKRDLYTKYYADVLVNKQIDSVVSDTEALSFYEINKDNFKLNESLVQFKFIQVDRDFDVKDIKKHFRGTEREDDQAIDSLKFQYKNYFLNDSTWVKRSAVIEQVNAINNKNVESTLKKANFIQLRDSLGLYLIAVKNTLDRNDMAPLQYVRPTINQIIINKRKLALIKKLEKEIKDDAIKNKEFEIYN